MLLAVSILLLVILIPVVVFQHKKFGKRPTGSRLERIKNSPNFVKGQFLNQSKTLTFTGGANVFKIAKEFYFSKNVKVRPVNQIPSIKIDLKNSDINKNILVWFGHSSYFIQIDGKRILVDPVFSDYASPFSTGIKAFKGTNIYTADDIPEIDFLFITHDHWDHLDYNTVKELKPKIKQIICPLGNGEHFEFWGFDEKKIIEMDWNDSIALGNEFIVSAVPSRHFSGRGFVRNKALWASFVLESKTKKIFLGCDGGYDSHFAEAGEKYGPFDLAILENGQYNKNWGKIHMQPQEVLKAANDLGARSLLPIHSCRFKLSTHAWDEPLERITALNKENKLRIITPLIGEGVDLDDSSLKFHEWWRNVN